jgi:hypothetical protein
MSVPAIPTPTLSLLEALDAKPIDLWDAWLFAETEASLALADWMQAPDEHKAGAYTTYVAALDREEQAALVLALGLDEQPAVTNWS